MRATIFVVCLLVLAGCQYPEVRRPADADDASTDTSDAAAATGAPEANEPAVEPDRDDAPAQSEPATPDAAAQISAPPMPDATTRPAEPEPEPATEAPEEPTEAPQPDAAQASPAEQPPAPVDASPANAGEALAGQIELAGMRGDEVTPAEAFSQTVVYFKPNQASSAPAPGNYAINTKAKRFEPDVLVVPVGSTVTFPNDDRILHNVFSLSPIAEFDLGFYGFNEARGHVFNTPGLALIHCNVHQSMQAEVLVVDTPFFTKPDSNGRFRFDDVPAGGGTLHVWNPRAGAQEIAIANIAQASPTVAIELTRPRVGDHVNKFGESY